MKTNPIVCVYGASGVGKTTITEQIHERYANKYNVVVSYTNRAKRSASDTDHIFVDRKAPRNALCLVELDGYQYWFNPKQFTNKINILVIEPTGILELKSKYRFVYSVLIESYTAVETVADKNRLNRKLDLNLIVPNFILYNNSDVYSATINFNFIMHKVIKMTYADSLNSN